MGSAEYDKKNTVMVSVKLNTKTDADIIHVLDGLDSKQGYIKDLILQDLYRKKAGSDIYVRM